MDQTFNTTEILEILEILEDKDLTIAQLRATIAAQSAALQASEQTVQNTNQLRLELTNELNELKQANSALSAQLQAPSFDQLVANMVRDRIESMVEAYFESETFTDKVLGCIDYAMSDYEKGLGDRVTDMLENSGEIERCLETALDDALNNVRISFR